MLLKVGSRSDTVRAVQRMLTEMGYHPEGIDGRYDLKTEKAVIRFQENQGLYSDGIVGPVTMDALEDAYMRHTQEITSPGADSTDGSEERYVFVRCKADKHKEGYSHLYLRQDAAEAYNSVRRQVLKLGGILTSSGGKRAVDAQLNSNRSATSFHYLGLALDLHIWSGMEDLENDPYVIRLADLTERRLEVFFKCASEDVPELEISDCVKYNDPKLLSRKTISGRYQNLTELFKDNGFSPIRARRRFIEDGYPLAAEWWHFQYENALTPYVSTFGGELLKVYSRQRLEKTAPWRFRDRTFKVNWF